VQAKGHDSSLPVAGIINIYSCKVSINIFFSIENSVCFGSHVQLRISVSVMVISPRVHSMYSYRVTIVPCLRRFPEMFKQRCFP
jgi:hypothetical protein